MPLIDELDQYACCLVRCLSPSSRRRSSLPPVCGRRRRSDPRNMRVWPGPTATMIWTDSKRRRWQARSLDIMRMYWITCEVLLMLRFDMEASELNGVFEAGLSDSYVHKVLDTFPLRKINASKAREGLLIV